MTALAYNGKLYGLRSGLSPQNHFIKEETMQTLAYLSVLSLEKPDVVKHGIESMWNIEGRQGDDGTCHDYEQSADGGQYELSAGICGTVRLAEAAVYRLGVYLCRQLHVLRTTTQRMRTAAA